MSGLIHCIYASAAARGFAEHEIPALLDHARANNARLGVTGMLLYVEGAFFQVIEGAEETIDALYSSIVRDPRHARVTQIIREPIARRDFGEWSMGFSTLGGAETGALIGVNDFFTDATCLTRLSGGRAKKILESFRGGRWRSELTGRFPQPGRVA